MAKAGYIFKAGDDDENYKARVKWMDDYGCDMIFTEEADTAKTRVGWGSCPASWNVAASWPWPKMSNTLRKAHELSDLIETCREKAVRLISIVDL